MALPHEQERISSPILRPVKSPPNGEIPTPLFPEKESPETPYQGSFFHVMKKLIPTKDFNDWQNMLTTITVEKVGIYIWKEHQKLRCVTIGDVLGVRRDDDNCEEVPSKKGGNHTLEETTEVCSYRWDNEQWRKERECWFDSKKDVENATDEEAMQIREALLEKVITTVVQNDSADIVKEPSKIVTFAGRKKRKFTTEDKKVFAQYGIL